MFVQAIYLKSMTLEQFREKICDTRCKVTDRVLPEGTALKLCEECPLNQLDLIGNLKPEEKENAN